MEDKLRSAIFGNTGTIIAFRVGAEDAKFLEREFNPTFREEDLTSLENYHIYLKLMIEGKTSDAFSAVTEKPPRVEKSFARKVVESSKRNYASIKLEINREVINKRIPRVGDDSMQSNLWDAFKI